MNHLLGERDKINVMIYKSRLYSDWELLTAADIARDEFLNPNGRHHTTINRLLTRNGFFARKNLKDLAWVEIVPFEGINSDFFIRIGQFKIEKMLCSVMRVSYFHKRVVFHLSAHREFTIAFQVFFTRNSLSWRNWIFSLGSISCNVPWASNFPDLNIIENVWFVVKDSIWRGRHEIADRDDL